MNSYLEFAEQLARQSGAIIKANFGLNMSKDWKEDNSPVTVTDIEINKLVIDAVTKNFPDHSILAEEESDLQQGLEKVWVCDPIDGTIPFSHGVPTCVFSLAYVENGRPIVGVVYDPFMDRMFKATLGGGAFLNDKPTRVNEHRTLDKTLIGPSIFPREGSNLSMLDTELEKRGAKVFDVCSVTYMGALVACGEVTATIFPGKKSHDTAALKVIVEEAGGKVTSLLGTEQDYNKNIAGHIISNGLVHEEIREILEQFGY